MCEVLSNMLSLGKCLISVSCHYHGSVCQQSGIQYRLN